LFELFNVSVFHAVICSFFIAMRYLRYLSAGENFGG
jgi:hypothetical protein